MKVILVRHGKTPGNLEKRYVGRTDEHLSEVGKKELAERVLQNSFPSVDALLVSPMIRCRETSSIIYNDIVAGGIMVIEPELREMDFGAFEYKNFKELDGDPEYQAYLDSGGFRNFPGGEMLKDFENRCVEGFIRGIGNVADQFMKGKQAEGKSIDQSQMTIGVVAHGGTIMALMNRFCTTKKTYYEWMLDNGAFYVCEWTGETLCWQDE